MSEPVRLQALLSEAGEERPERLALFALLSLGVIESLFSGVLSPSDAVRAFFTADNCLSVRVQLRNKAADEVMGCGVQLPDLYEALPAEQAQPSASASWRPCAPRA